jgi:hypothetical protein
VIFSHVLYQLSYLGTVGRGRALEPENHITRDSSAGHCWPPSLRA